MDISRQETIRKYADIIYLDRPEDLRVLSRHPRMAVADRAKIFAPFAALRGHGERLGMENTRLLRQRRIEFSDEEIRRLSEKLSQVKKGMQIEVMYFDPDPASADVGWYVRRSGTVTGIDEVYQTLKIDDQTIRFGDVADIVGDGVLQMELKTE